MKRLPCLACLLLVCCAAGAAAADDAAALPDPAPSNPAPTDREIADLVGRLGHPDFDIREQAERSLVQIGEPARSALKAAAESNDPEVRERAERSLREIDVRTEIAQAVALCRGRKVLVSFRRDAVVPDAKRKPTKKDVARARKALCDEIKATLARADVDLLRVTRETRDARAGRTYEAIMLLDCGDADPEKALEDVPCRGAGIVFRDGHYHAAIPVGEPPSRRVRRGQIPAAYAFMAWGSGEQDRLQRDLQRLADTRGVHVAYTPPPPGSGGSAGSAMLTPDPGHTLLEVFIRTGAGFRLVDPPAKRPAPADPAGGETTP